MERASHGKNFTYLKILLSFILPLHSHFIKLVSPLEPPNIAILPASPFIHQSSACSRMEDVRKSLLRGRPTLRLIITRASKRPTQRQYTCSAPAIAFKG